MRSHRIIANTRCELGKRTTPPPRRQRRSRELFRDNARPGHRILRLSTFSTKIRARKKPAARLNFFYSKKIYVDGLPPWTYNTQSKRFGASARKPARYSGTPHRLHSLSRPHRSTRSTQPCIPPGSLNRVPASAGVKAGMSPLPGGR